MIYKTLRVQITVKVDLGKFYCCQLETYLKLFGEWNVVFHNFSRVEILTRIINTTLTSTIIGVHTNPI